MVIMKKPNRLLRCCSLILFLLLMGFKLQAQNFGEFTGAVEDASGAVISGATVSASNAGTGQTRQVLTNASGTYSLPYLVPENYDLRVETPGFKTSSRRSITLEVGAVLRVDFR